MIPVTAALSMLCLGDGLPTGPVTAGLYDGDLGRARRVCVRDEVGLTGGAYLVADSPNFYGHLVGGATLDGSYTVAERTEVFATFEAFRYDSVISALTSSYVGLGHTAVGANHVLAGGDRLALALNGKVVLPTAFGLYEHSWPIAADVGLAGAYATSKKLWVHGQVGGLVSAAASRGPTQTRVGAAVTLGAEWRAGRSFGLVADLSTGLGYTAPLDVVAGALGVRFSDGERWGLELGGTVPFAGRERAAATVDLRNTIRFGKIDHPSS